MKLQLPTDLLPRTKIAVFTTSAFKGICITPHTVEELEGAFNANDPTVGVYSFRTAKDKDEHDEWVYFWRDKLVAWAIAEIPVEVQREMMATRSGLIIAGKKES